MKRWKKKFRIVEIISIYGGTHFEVQQQLGFFGIPFLPYWTDHFNFLGENYYAESRAATFAEAQRILETWIANYELRFKKTIVKEHLIVRLE